MTAPRYDFPFVILLSPFFSIPFRANSVPALFWCPYVFLLPVQENSCGFVPGLVLQFLLTL